jgi:hypothetical protein
MIIQRPFGPWEHGAQHSIIMRKYDNLAISVSLLDYSVRFSDDEVSSNISKEGSLVDAITTADQYLNEQYVVAEVLEKLLAESQERVKELEEKVKTLELEKAFNNNAPTLEPRGWPSPKPELYKVDAVSSITVPEGKPGRINIFSEDIPF